MISAFLVLLKSLSWQTWLVVGIAVAGALVYAEKTAHIDLLEHQLESRDAQIAAAKKLADETDIAYRAQEKQTQAAQKDIADESQRLSIRARDDSSAAHTALDKLLLRAASGGQAASNSQIASGSTSAEGTGLRTDLLGGVGEEAIRYGAIADVARIGRAECEAKYDALTP